MKRIVLISLFFLFLNSCSNPNYYEDKIDGLESELSDLENNNRALMDEVDELKDELDDMQDMLNFLLSSLEELRDDLNNVMDTIDYY